MIIKKRNPPGREPFIGHTEFYTKRLLDAVAFSTPVLTQLRSRLRAVKHRRTLGSCWIVWFCTAHLNLVPSMAVGRKPRRFRKLLVAIIFVKTHCILDFFSSCLPSQGHTSFSERTIDTFPKILCLGLSSSLRCVDQRKFGIHFALL